MGMPDVSGGGNPWDLIKSFLPGGDKGIFGIGEEDMLRYGALASALNQYNNSGKYMDMAGKYAHEMNP